MTQVPVASCHHQNERVAILLQVFACSDDCNQMLWEEYESRGVYLTLPTKSLPGPICSHLKGLPELPVVSEQSSTFDTICDPAQVAPFPSRKVWSCYGDNEPDGALGGVVFTIGARNLRRKVNWELLWGAGKGEDLPVPSSGRDQPFLQEKSFWLPLGWLLPAVLGVRAGGW